MYSTTEREKKEPLPFRLMPRSLEEFVGQEHILGKGKALRRFITEDKLTSAIFFGPPGTGKTSLGNIIAQRCNSTFIHINSLELAPDGFKRTIQEVDKLGKIEKGKTVLFVDEVHRLTRTRQEFLLPFLERGSFIFLGSTVENPFFTISKPLLSRALLFEFKPLELEDIEKILKIAIEDKERGFGSIDIELEEGVLKKIAVLSDGDARRALNYLESVVKLQLGSQPIFISMDILKDITATRMILYDRSSDEHYDTISAFIKSMRGSDPDATLYWLAKMLEAGEDPRFLLRRMLIFAAEDIGLADPNALNIASSALTGFEGVGLPEGELILAETALYLATAPKSNTVIESLSKAKKILKEKRIEDIPQHLRDSHSRGAQRLKKGTGYRSPHYIKGEDTQEYLPRKLRGAVIFRPRPVGYESKLKKERRP